MYEPERHFMRLLRRFQQLRERAHTLSTPNPEDDLLARLAIVGFSHVQRTEAWSVSHYTALQAFRRSETSTFPSIHGQHASTWEQYACLVFGFLLGAQSRGRISELEFSRGLFLLSAFMWLHAPEFDALPDFPRTPSISGSTPSLAPSARSEESDA